MQKCRALAYFCLKVDRKLPPFFKPRKNVCKFTGFFSRTHCLGLYLHRVCFERPERNQTLGRRCFGVPGDLYVSSTEKYIFKKNTTNGDRRTAPIKKRRPILGGRISLEGNKKAHKKKRQSDRGTHASPFLDEEWQLQRHTFRWQQLLWKPRDVS